MKKTSISILLMLLAILSWTGTQAQLRVGVKGGGSMSTSYGSPEKLNGEEIEDVDLRPGFQIGMFLTYEVTEAFSLMSEIDFERRNGKKGINLTFPAPSPAGDIIVKTNAEIQNTFNYLNMPVLAVLGKSNLKFYGGPNFAYLLSATSDRTTMTDVTLPAGLPPDTPGLPQSGTVETEVDYINDKPFDTDGSFINHFEMGFNLGVMYLFGENLLLDLRANNSLVDITNNDYDQSLIPPNESRSDTDRNFSVQLSVGMMF